MFCRVHWSFLSQDLLRPRNLIRVDPAIAVMPESRSELRARSERHPHTSRAAVEVQHQIHMAADIRGDFFDLRMAFEYACEAGFHNHANAQIGPVGFEKGQCRCGENAVAEGPQADHGNPRARRKPRQQRFHFSRVAYSSMRASSTSITGMSSRIG